jgi:hypothetical protein
MDLAGLKETLPSLLLGQFSNRADLGLLNDLLFPSSLWGFSIILPAG